MSEDLTLTPAHGAFDLERVKTWLDARPDAFQDPHLAHVYVITGHPAIADSSYGRRLEDPSRFPYDTIVSLSPTRIHLAQQMSDRDAQRSAMDLVRWLVTSEDVVVRADESNRDLTSQIREHGVESLYPPHVAGLPLAWEGSLIAVGFFRDFDRGDSATVWIKDARRDAPIADEDRLIEYLRSGRLQQRSDVIVHDVLSPDYPDVGVADHLTDGVYVWPADLPYQVRHYHVRLPRHFVLHARALGWKVPGSDGPVWPPPPDEIGPASSLVLELPHVVLGRRLRAGTGDEVREGYLLADPSARVLITLTTRHPDEPDEVREQLEPDVDGIAPLRWIERMPSGSIDYDDVLVEDLPAGEPASTRMPLPEAAVIRIGAALAATIARVHAAGKVGVSVLPELVYVDGALAFLSLVPRGCAFIYTSPPRTSGPRSYPIPYEGYETLILGQRATAASDVFKLCATLHTLATGAHPFGASGELREIVGRVAADARTPYPGSPALGALLARGLARDPAARPTAAELATALAAL
jgi:hypothetical protein